MKKLVVLFILIFINITFVSADETTSPTITGVSYDGNLSQSTIINVQGTNLGNCDNLTVGDKSVGIVSKSESLITYNFKDSNNYSSTLKMSCNGVGVNYVFSFPNLEKITGFTESNFDRTITITGKGFGEGANIELSGGLSFEIISSNENSIYGRLPENLESTDIWVISGGKKSNVYKMPIFIPKITHLVSQSGFKKGSKITIYGNYLNKYNNYSLKIGEDNINKSTYNSSTQTITFELPEYIGTKQLQVFSNGISSNKIDIASNTNRAEITNIEEKQEIVDSNMINKLYIYGKNFGNIDIIKVYLNGEQISLGEFISEGLISLRDYKLNSGNNYFEISVNGKKSYVYNFKTSTSRLPELGGYNVTNTNYVKKTISLYLNNYNKLTDKVYFNNQELTLTGCNVNTCNTDIDDNVLSGDFVLKRGAYTSPVKLKYDVVYDSTPYITSVKFGNKVGKTVRIEINGGNFLNADISQSNLFSLDENQKPVITQTNNLIVGYFPADYDINTQSTFSISKNGLDTNISFVGKDLGTDREIYGQPLLKSFISKGDDGLFKPGVKVEIDSKNLHLGDIVNIGDKKVEIVYNGTNEKSYFILPNVSEYKEYDVTITNKYNQTSNPIKMLIVDKQYKEELSVDNLTVSKKNFYSDDLNSINSEVYGIKITNKIKDIVAKKLTFKVLNYDKNTKLGTFELRVNNLTIGKSGINDAGEIIFEYVNIPKQQTEVTLSLFKSSVFINTGEFKIMFDKINSLFIDEEKFEYKNVNYSDFITNNIIVYSSEELSCIDSESSNINCNSLKNGNSGVGQIKEVDTSEGKQTTNLVQDTTNTTTIQTEINILTYKFKTKGYNNLNTQFLNFGKSAVSNPKYSTKLGDIEKTINNILKSLYGYDNAKAKSVEKKLYLKKLKLDLAKFKELIK